jgi:pullulanase
VRRAACAAALWLAVRAAAADESVDVCDAAAPTTVLQAAAEVAPDARAVWLDDTRVRWPGVTLEGRFRLYHSAAGTMDVQDGRLTGADGFVALELVPGVDMERFRWLGAGTELRLAEEASVRPLLRSQLLAVHEDERGRVLETTGTQLAAAIDAAHPAALDFPLGVSFGALSTRFGVWAPTARSVWLCLYDTSSSFPPFDKLRTSRPAAGRESGCEGSRCSAPGSPPARARRMAMLRDDASGAWSLELPEDARGKYYAYAVEVHAPGAGLVRNRVTDPYALSLTTDSALGYVADLTAPALKPEGWDAQPVPKLAAPVDMAIYELHVRDFSRDDASVPPEHRGKYLAFTHADSAGMHHLRALAQAGITDIHLLPVFDIASVPEAGCIAPAVPEAAPDSPAQQATIAAGKESDCFNWGYDPWHYTAPEGSYATDAADGAVRILEFRCMVQALHAAGLRVGMDVVYNHTTASGQRASAVLDRIVPGYYHRLDKLGNVEHSTCCDNTATEHPMMARLMIDSVATWARDYRIDSFRFDLMGHQPRAAMERLQSTVDAAAGRHVELLGEGWNFGEVKDGARFVQASQLSLNGSGIATFSDRLRDAARGGSAGDNGVAQVVNQGWLNGLSYAPNEDSRGHHSHERLLEAADLVRVGLAGSLRDYELHTWRGPRLPLERIDYAGQPAGYVSQPGEVVNYVENHDNQTLFDLDAFKLPPDTSREDRARVQVLGAALVAFSQGIAYFHAGMDVLRSKSMDRNSFDSGDWFNPLDWSYRSNGFGRGLPPEADNRVSWEWMQRRLADPRIAPRPQDIAFARDAFRDLLRIRASSTLFRLRTAQDVQQRLHLLNTGPAQNAMVVAARIDGGGYPGAGFDDVLYAINASPEAQVLRLESERGKTYALHPVHRDKRAADRRIIGQARFDAATGTLTVPGRSAVVFVTGKH